MKSRTMPRNSAKGARPVSGQCSDCGALDANWTSVNRGVLMCNDCASVHMGLGRHISQVKHIQKSTWHPNLQSLVTHLVNAGANSIWEHALLDPAQMRSGKRKPNPSDNIHPTKSEFIKSKYLNLSYVLRLPIREEEHHDISKQLHSSVRTGNLETSLRLLSHGAHADYFNTEKGNTPLHVAAKCGQVLQVELLVAYGADPCARDSNGKTAEDLARAENHSDLADRLVELQYEVSDKFTMYVCGETPDHKAGKHYILPKIKDALVVSPEGRKRLQGLSNQTFEVLAMDVYDEVERRELERIWQEVQKSVLIPGKGTNPALQVELVPFLPLHPDYSSTRNQGRQKLAHFKESELNNLISDIIQEITCREKIFGPIPPSVPEEDPIYDVPPEEDHEELNVKEIEQSIEPQREMVPKEEFLALKKEVEERDEEISKLREQNRELTSKVTNLARENHELSRKLSRLQGDVAKNSTTSTPPQVPQPQTSFVPHTRLGIQSPGARPSSVYNPNDSSGSQSSLHSVGSDMRRYTVHEGATNEELQQILQQSPMQTDAEPIGAHHSYGSEYENNDASKDDTGKDVKVVPAKNLESALGNSNTNNNHSQSASVPSAPPEQDVGPEESVSGDADETEEKSTQQQQSTSSSPNSQPDTTDEQVTWPEVAALRKKTEHCTRMIQTLLQTATNKKVESYLECAENILSAVSDIVALFDKPHMPAIKSVLQQLCGSAHKLRNRCKENMEQKNKPENHKHLTEEIIAYAYEIAKAEKQLVMMQPKDEPETSA